MTLTDDKLARINQLFSYLNISQDHIQVEIDDDTVSISVDVPEEEAGIFIGRYANTLDSIQLILSLFLRSDIIHHVHLDIGGYRGRRADVLREMADRIAADVIESSSPRAFPPLSATERRTIHLIFEDHETLTTYSEGMGYNRRLILGLKSA